MRRLRLRLGLGLGLAAALATAARADQLDDRATGMRGSAEINTALAAAGYAIPLDAPPFHGIAPALAAHYGSSGGNGWLGVGWSLSGIGAIERTGARGGSPRWDRSDTFTLDGEPLVACRPDAPQPPAVSSAGTPPVVDAGSATPGCAAGGTHATRVESHRRIVYDPASSTWIITDPDGMRRTYAAVYQLDAQRRWRYGLTDIADPHGNAVHVTWSVNLFGCCEAMPTAIAYGDAAIDLVWQARPADAADVETSANGGGLETRHARLGALAMRVAGQPLRAYRFDYATSAAHGRSLLQQVTQYGRDFQVAGGTVASGSALPPFRVRYADTATTDYRVVTSPRPAGYVTNPDSFQTGDIDGDGHADVIQVGPNHGRAIITWRGRDDGTLAQPVTFDPGPSASFSRGSFYPVDIDGDGRSDLVQLPGGWGGAAWTSRGDGTFAAATAPGGVWYCDTPQCRNAWSTMLGLPADIDGDGRTDFVFAETRSPFTGPVGGPTDSANIRIDRLRIALSRGTTAVWAAGGSELTQPLTLAASSSCGSYTCTSSGSLLTGDVDGDGRTDVIFVEEGRVSVFRSTGSDLGSAPIAVQTGTIRPNNAQSRVFTGDFNGDGRTDLLVVPLQFGPVPLATWLSRGDGTFAILPAFTLGPVYGTFPSANQRFLIADVNGDGRTDVVHILANEFYTWLARGDGRFSLVYKGGLTAQQNNFDAMTTGDVDGDGRMDIVYMPLSAGMLVYSPMGSGRPLATEIETPLGGKTRFEYTPSTRWASAQMPVAGAASTIGAIGDGRGGTRMPASFAFATLSAMTSDDGRGTLATTRYEYSGALYDPVHRELLGYRRVKETRPAVDGGPAPFTETWYVQGYGLRGLTERIDVDAGGLASSTVNELAIGTTVPYTQDVAATWQYRYAPRAGGGFDPAVYRRTYVSRVRDAYGNVTDEADHGDYDVIGDERLRFARFAPSAATYIVDRPFKDGVVDLAWHPLEIAYHVYDGAPDASLPPSRGDLTASWVWLDDGDGAESTGDRYLPTRHGYDARGNLVWAEDATGARTTVTYDAADHPVSAMDPNGLVATTEWDLVCGAPSAKLDPAGARTTTSYDGFCRPISTSGPLAGMGAEHDYQQLGTGAAVQYIVERVRDPSGASPWVENRIYLDGLGRPWRQMRAAGTALAVCQDTGHDARGNNNATSRPYACAAETPVWERSEIDGLDRPRLVRHPDGTTITFQYGLDTTARIDEAGQRVEDEVDARGQLVAHREWQGSAVAEATTERDRLGRVVRVIDPAGNLRETAYDTLGRVVRRDDPDLGTWRYVHDDAGRAITTIDARGQRLATRYDRGGRPIGHGVEAASPRVVTVEVRAGAPAAFAVEVDGQRIFDGNADDDGTTVTWTGDVVASIAVIPAVGGALAVIRIEVDGAAIAPAISDGCGTAAAMTCGRAVAIVADASTVTYDAAGRPTFLVDGTGSTSLQYDTAGRVTERAVTIGEATYRFSSRFGAAGQLLGARYPDGEVVGADPVTGTGSALTYDALGRPRNLPGVVSAIAWDSAGRVRRLDFANGSSSIDDYAAQRGWLTRTRVSSGGADVLDLTYGYDARGLVFSVRGTDQLDFQYDARRRLTAVLGPAPHTYAYDPLGNMTSQNGVAYAYPAAGAPRPHAVTARGTDAFTYDANGNMLSGAGRTIEWDPFNRPRTIATTASTSSLAYDGGGQRRVRIVDGVVTHYPAPGYEVTGGVAIRTVEIAGRTIAQRTAGTWRWLHTDRLGSVRAITDATGAVVARRSYTPYGAPLSGAGTTTVGFIGEHHDDATGLLYLGARYYDPALGRFISPDTVTPDAGLIGLDRYAYAFDNPLSFTDRNGHDPWQDALKKYDPHSKEYKWLIAQHEMYIRLLAANTSDENRQAFCKWVARGLQFVDSTGPSGSTSTWTASAIEWTIIGFEFTAHAIGENRVIQDLGMRGSTRQHGTGELRAYADPGISPYTGHYNAAEGSLRLSPDAYTTGVVHAIGEALDLAWLHRGNSTLSSTGNWLLAANFNPNIGYYELGGIPGERALHSMEQDFAETFVWFVFIANHIEWELTPALVFARPSESRLQFMSNAF